MIPCECQSCHQEMSVPDSLAGHFESCPACKAIVAVPGPNDSPWPRVKSSTSPAANTPSPAAASFVPALRKPAFGIERLLEFVGVLIAAIGLLGIVLGVALLFLPGRENAVSAYGSIGSGVISFPAGLALAALGSAGVELKKIRMLLQDPGAPGSASR